MAILGSVIMFILGVLLFIAFFFCLCTGLMSFIAGLTDEPLYIAVGIALLALATIFFCLGVGFIFGIDALEAMFPFLLE